MYFTFGFHSSGDPQQVVHVEWLQRRHVITACRIFVFHSQTQVEMDLFAEGNITENRENLSEFSLALPRVSVIPAVILQGTIALNIRAALLVYKNGRFKFVEALVHSPIPEFIEFIDLRTHGLLIWFDDETTKVALVSSKKQAASTMRGLVDWINPEILLENLSKITHSKLQDHSTERIVYIFGKFAELISHGIAFIKIRASLGESSKLP